MKNTVIVCAAIVLSLCFVNVSAYNTASSIDWSKLDPTDLGPRVVDWDYTDIRPISAVPAVGVHPRIFFGPGDLTEMRTRLTTTDCGIEVMAQINAYKELMYRGYGVADGYSHSADYAVDPQGNRRIDNAGYYDSSVPYAALAAGDMSALDGVDNTRRGIMAGTMAVMAFQALIENDVDMAEDIATAITTWVSIVSPSFSGYSDLTTMGNVHLAYCYDLIYNYMTPAQQSTVRAGIAKMLQNKYHYGTFLEYYATTSNWTTLDSFLPLIAMSIEGELDAAGNATTQNVYNGAVRAFHNFLTYGWYKSGCPLEGQGKNYMFVTTLVAMEKRGEKFTAHPHVKAFGEKHMPMMVQPYGYSFVAYDDWAGTGNTPVIGGYKFNFHDAVGLKWILPNSPEVDFIWRNWIGENYEARWVVPKGYNNDLLCMAIFASDFEDGPWDFAGLNKPMAQLAPERGLATLRSGFEKDDIFMQLHCRQDMGGHTHADKNNFIFSALGRNWGCYRTGASGGATGVIQEMKYHSCIMIDGVGVPLTYRDGTKARQPGKIVAFDDFEMASFVTGDAEYAYDWEFDWTAYPAGVDNPLINSGWEPVLETHNDFMYQQGKEDYYDISLYDYANWNAEGMLERIVKRPANPVEKAYRTAGVVRGEKPYALIIDDIKKDSGYHNYQWIMQMESDLSIDASIVGINPSTDAVLKGSEGDERLLVRILQAESIFAAAPNMDFLIEPRYETSNWNRLNIHAYTVIEPKYKVMLYPFKVGDSLPATFWQGNQLTIMMGSQADVYDFTENADGLTEFTITRDNEVIFTSYCADVPADGDVSGDNQTDLEDMEMISQSWGYCYGVEDIAKLAEGWLNGI